MSLWRDLWNDEGGALVSAELVAVGTVAVLAGTSGLHVLSTSVNQELSETAFAVRSLNQSYAFNGQASCGAWTAGSCYTQPDVEKSLAELHDLVGQQRVREEERIREERNEAPLKKKKKPSKRQQREAQDEPAFLEPAPPAGQPDQIAPADDVTQSEVVIDAAAPDA